MLDYGSNKIQIQEVLTCRKTLIKNKFENLTFALHPSKTEAKEEEMPQKYVTLQHKIRFREETCFGLVQLNFHSLQMTRIVEK